MSANGRDKRGQGLAKATIESSMSEAGSKTHVDVVTDFTLTGRLARFGRGGMIEDVSNKMVGDFVDCLRSSLESEGSAGAAGDGGRRRGCARAAAGGAAGARRAPLPLSPLDADQAPVRRSVTSLTLRPAGDATHTAGARTGSRW